MQLKLSTEVQRKQSGQPAERTEAQHIYEHRAILAEDNEIT